MKSMPISPFLNLGLFLNWFLQPISDTMREKENYVKKIINVVAATIEKDGKFFCAQKPEGKSCTDPKKLDK